MIEIEQSIRAKVDAGIARDLATVKGCYGLLVDWEPYTAVAAAICDLAKAHPNIPEVKALVLALTTPRREHELEDVEQIAAEVAEEALA